jgi:hypothetical protein
LKKQEDRSDGRGRLSLAKTEPCLQGFETADPCGARSGEAPRSPMRSLANRLPGSGACERPSGGGCASEELLHAAPGPTASREAGPGNPERPSPRSHRFAFGRRGFSPEQVPQMATVIISEGGSFARNPVFLDPAGSRLKPLLQEDGSFGRRGFSPERASRMATVIISERRVFKPQLQLLDPAGSRLKPLLQEWIFR